MKKLLERSFSPAMAFLRSLFLAMAWTMIWTTAGLAPTRISAQDPIFSQFYAMPLQINPAFSGSAGAPRAGLAYRNQWTGFQSAYRTYAAYYEQSFDRLNSGIGFHLEGDNAGDGIFVTNRFSGAYAYRIKVNEQIARKQGSHDRAKLARMAHRLEAYGQKTPESLTLKIYHRNPLGLGTDIHCEPA